MMNNEEKILAILMEMREDMSNLKADVTRLNHNLEPKAQAIYEGFQDMLDKHERLDVVETKVEKHDARIWALEQAVNK